MASAAAPSHPFCTVELAARIERAECELLTGAAQVAEARGADRVLSRRLAGGVATWTELGSPLCKVAGLGFGGSLDLDQLGELERLFADRETPMQVELSSLGDPSIAALLTEHGYRLVGFENVLIRPLAAGPKPSLASDLEIVETGPGELPTWLDVAVTGFATPDTRGVVSHESFPREALESTMSDMASAGGFHRYLARRDGIPAGVGGLRISSEGIAQLCGAATLPEHRRRGVQAALLAVRLSAAAAAGCDLAVVTTQPGSTSQQNVERCGFRLAYVRAVLVGSG